MTFMSEAQTRPTSGPRLTGLRTLLRRLWRDRMSYILLLPFLIPFAIFTLMPIIASGYLSLTEYKANTFNYIGFDNFKNLLALDIRVLPQQVSKTSGQPLYRCDGKQVEQSQIANATNCTILYVSPREIIPTGYSELSRGNVMGTQFILSATDKRFWTAIGNTLIYAALVVPLTTVLGLGLALVLQKQNRFNYLLRTIFFLPSITSTVAVILVWRWIFMGEDFGLMNTLFQFFGFNPVSFLVDKHWTIPIMVLVAVWGGVGYTMILCLAGLGNISAELYEAAAIDGANQFSRFWSVTLPLLRPTMIYVVVTGVISALQVFDSVYIIFGSVERIGGVLDSGLTVVPYLYDTGFRRTQLGYASSMAWILFIIIFVITLINLRVGRVNEVD